MKKLILVTIVVFTLLFTLSLAAAAVPGGADVSGETDRGEYLYDITDQNTSVEAGNIQYVDLESNQSTYRWAGILGNVSGNIILGDSSDDILFTWTAKGRVVYATEAASIAWGSLDAQSGAATVIGQIPAYYDGTDDSDNFTETFTSTTGDVDSGIFTLNNVYQATTLGGTGWYTYALYDGSALVFAGNVNATGDTAYDGATNVHYQMIVPEDGTAGGTAATEYNLWVELQ